ncbi:MAG: hypothetical protein ACXWQO_17925 [Bdellovibrionota bacterium]
MKYLVLAVLVFSGFSGVARADDEISCATDNECIKAKADAGYEQFKRNEASEARTAHKKKKSSVQKPAEEPYVPCAGSDDCQRGKQDAIDHGNGEKVDD